MASNAWTREIGAPGREDPPALRHALRDGAARRRAARGDRRLAAARGHLHRARGARELSAHRAAHDRRRLQGAPLLLGRPAGASRRTARAQPGDHRARLPRPLPGARGAADRALLGRLDRDDAELPAVDRRRSARTARLWHALGYNGHGVAQATAVGRHPRRLHHRARQRVGARLPRSPRRPCRPSPSCG